MRVLDSETRRAVQQVIDTHLEELRAVPGFVGAEPGFPLINGRILRRAAIVVFVTHKRAPSHLLPEERMPRQLGPYRVAVMQADPQRQLEADKSNQDFVAALDVAASQLVYRHIPGDPIDQVFKVEKPFLCHVGPDAGWPVLKPFIEATRTTLSVAMYDFNADYIATTFIETVRGNKLKAVLTWDDSMTAPETVIRGKLKEKLAGRLDGAIVQCGAGRRFASAYHEKVAVRDSSAFWLSSGNWSLRSQPEIDPIGDPASAKGMYSRGNREWHVIVEDEALARVFEQYIKYDLGNSKEELDGAAALDQPAALRMPDLFVARLEAADDAPAALAPPEPVAPKILPSSARAVRVRPLLTPDNYIDRVVALLKRARRSIYLQYAYINYSDKPNDRRFTAMLGLLADLSNKPGIDLRIIVGSNGAADKIRLLVQAGFRETAFRTQGNIHNKGIIVDGKVVLVSSANWSADGVLRNRDAGLIIEDRDIAAYYEAVFLDDWNRRAKSQLADDAPVLLAADGAETPAGMVRMSWREYHS